MPLKTVISCLADRQPKYARQAALFIASLRASGVSEDDASTQIVVHVPEDMLDAPDFDLIRELGGVLAPFRRFGPDRPGAFCNKLRQLETPLLREADQVLLADADLFFAGDPRAFFKGDAVRGKIVDKASPPAEVIAKLYDHLGMAMPELAAPNLEPDQPTPRFNCNGGAYFLPKAAFAALATRWPEYARICLDPEVQALLGEFGKHADQLSFALAMQELALPFDPLPIGANFPTNFPPHRYRILTPAPITAFHYHHLSDEDGFPLPVGVDWIDRQIAEALDRL